MNLPLTIIQINARMRDAGFEGTSRSLKTLRDETVFINQIVASVEEYHGSGVASLVFYHIFSKNFRPRYVLT
jgi:hypothetical protein